MEIRKVLVIALLCLTTTKCVSEEVDLLKVLNGEDMADSNDNDVDQVALESDPAESSQKVIYHQSPNIPQSPSRGNIQAIPLTMNHPFGPPPPPPKQTYQVQPHISSRVQQQQPQLHNGVDQQISASSANEVWTSPVEDMPKIIALDVKCEKNGMKVFLQFDKPFFGIVFSKGHFSNKNCVHLPAGLGRTSITFDVGLHACGTAGNTENGVYGFAHETGSGSYFENIIVIQYDPQVQEVWDQARKLRCTWHDQYEKSVTFRPFPVDMLDVVRADFAGDNVGCWMQIQVGKGPWASEVSGLVKIGQTMTMVLAIKDDDSKFDMLVRNCVAHDGKRAPIQLVDQRGCVTRPKLMSKFTKIKNFGASASVLSYAHFQAFKFPDSMEVHFQCTIQICRYKCPEQCSDPNLQEVHHLQAGPESQYAPSPSISLESYMHGGKGMDNLQSRRTRSLANEQENVGLNRVIRVVSSGDLTFPIDEKVNGTNPTTMVFPAREEGLICMTTPGFTITLIVLIAILVTSCLISAILYVKLRPFSMARKEAKVAYTNPQLTATLPHIIPAHTTTTLIRNGLHT